MLILATSGDVQQPGSRRCPRHYPKTKMARVIAAHCTPVWYLESHHATACVVECFPFKAASSVVPYSIPRRGVSSLVRSVEGAQGIFMAELRTTLAFCFYDIFIDYCRVEPALAPRSGRTLCVDCGSLHAVLMTTPTGRDARPGASATGHNNAMRQYIRIRIAIRNIVLCLRVASSSRLL